MSDDLRLQLSLVRDAFDLRVDLTLPASGITALFGSSGSGKTTLLRCVAGLEPEGRGTVRIGSDIWQDDPSGHRLPTWQRPLGYVFQEASLFEHLDVRRNLSYGLKRSRLSTPSTPSNGLHALEAAIELLGIGHLLDRRADQLSGGERQRVAIARALAAQPRLLLLDEPLAALDQARRQDILPWLERLRDELSIPMLYVTHAFDEVARLADHLVVMAVGRVQAAGPVHDVLTAIDSPVMLGDDAGTLIQARVTQRDLNWHLAKAEFDGGCFWIRDGGHALGETVRLRILARDVSLQLQEPTQTSIQNHLQAVVVSITDDVHPSQAMLRLQCGQDIVMARLTRKSVHALGLSAGMRVWAQVKAVAVIG